MSLSESLVVVLAGLCSGGRVAEFLRGSGGKLPEHDAEVTDLDHRFAGVRVTFVVLTVATAATVPSVAPFHYPANSDRSKSLRAGRR